MTNRLILIRAGLAAVVLAVAACGSNPSSPTPSAASSTATSPTAAGSPAAGGLEAERWCLDTVDEVARELGVKVVGVTGSEVPGLGGGCGYNREDGSPIMTVSVFTSRAALSTFNAAQIAQGAIEVTDVGDEAILVTQRGPLVIRAGNVVVSITVAPTPSMNDVTRLRAAFETLGRAAVRRIPPE